MLTERIVTSVWLVRNMEIPHIFFCPNCQCPEFQYQGSVAMIVPGEAPIPFPLIIKCKNKNCPCVYHVGMVI